jgi:hypothetical protein
MICLLECPKSRALTPPYAGEDMEPQEHPLIATKNEKWGWGHSSVVEYLPSMSEALSLILSIKIREEKKGGRERWREGGREARSKKEKMIQSFGCQFGSFSQTVLQSSSLIFIQMTSKFMFI